MRQRLSALAGAALVLAAQPLCAQEKKLNFNVGAGATIPLSDAADRFETGWNFAAGISYDVADRVGLRLDYIYNDHDVKGDLFDVTRFDANHSMQSASLNLVFTANPDAGASVYLLAGPSWYQRSVEITEFEGYVPGYPICDPWLWVCYPTSVPVESVLGSRSEDDWGVNVGVGVSFRLGSSTRLYLESRYHYIFGEEYTLPSGGRQKATGQYLPLTVGLRF